ncbi:OTU domain-containing protein 4 isoform X2 [Xyrichtys novacula]|nr:OTU domain-containing protein 4 isoform X2 [Xyrichtys novacula]
MYKRDFQIFQEPGRPAVNITDNNFKDKVRLCFLNGNHYDSVYPVSRIKNAALCQSILFELLYDDVFKADKSSLGVCQKGTTRPRDPLIDDNMVTCASSDESDVDAGEPVWVDNGTSTTAPRHNNRGRGRGRALSERVWRSLNPTLLRNIEYDVWLKTKRAQQKLDYSIAAGMQFSVGDRCQVSLEGSGRSYNATVKEVPSDNGLVTVFVEELGKRQCVPLWRLRPCDENSWSTVVNRDKKLSNGHGDWEEKGKGKGRGKHIPVSSSVTTATAQGSSGRVQKQHSWPSQANAEEGGAKPSRKSVSSVDKAFGITEEQRLAKEEEKMNVALVEIQLRDENSFPALGAQSGSQGDGGRKKGAEKRRSQRNKTKSPVEDIRALSPSSGERPKSSSPPLTTTATSSANTAETTTPTTKPRAAPPSADSDAAPAFPSSHKASSPSAPSYASAAAGPPVSPTAAAAGPGGAVPSSASLFSFITPVLPPASSPPTSHAPFLPSLPPSSSSSAPAPSSVSTPTFIAPIAPSPSVAQGALHPSSLSRSSTPVSPLPHSPSPPLVSSSPLTQTGAQIPQNQTRLPQVDPQMCPPQNQDHISESQPIVFTQTPLSLPHNQSRVQTAVSENQPNQTPLTQDQTQIPTSLTQKQTPPVQDPAEIQTPLIQNQTQMQTPFAQNKTLPFLPPNQTQLTQTQTPTIGNHAQIHTSLTPNQTLLSLPQTQTCTPQLQSQSQPNTEVTQIPTTVPQISASHPLPHYPPQSEPEEVQDQSSYSLPPQAPVSVPQPPVPHPQPHVQHPHPSQVPNPSSQTQSESPPHPAPQQSHPSHPSHLPQSLPAHPPPLSSQPSSIPGTVPLEQLSQLYQDPLYPGFPQGEKGQPVPLPPMSTSRSGDDLPQDINVLRFFFNLGVKVYSMPMFPPYVYLFPLQQAHAMHPKMPSRSPSPSPNPPYPPSNPPPRPQEHYPQYPPNSASMHPQYDHQAPPTEPPHSSELSYPHIPRYPVSQHAPHRMPPTWQQHQMPPNFSVGYSSPNPTYAAPPPISQAYHQSQSPGHPLYPPTLPQYPPSSLGYQSSSTPEEVQGSQGTMEQHHPSNGDTVPRQHLVHATSLLGNPPTANMANNNLIPSFAHMKEHAENLTRAMMIGEQRNSNPLMMSNLGDVPVSSTTMKTNSTPVPLAPYEIISTTATPTNNNPSYGFRGYAKPLNPNPNTFVPLGVPEPKQTDYLSMPAMSVGCSTEDDLEEQPSFKSAQYRGPRRGRGGRGRASHSSGRGANRRGYGGVGDSGLGIGNVQFFPSHRGRGRERGY